MDFLGVKGLERSEFLEGVLGLMLTLSKSV